MNTDLELYRIFCEVVKNKNISKTAEKMYVSQSAVTQSIQKLENLLGGKVFHRNKNGVELTEEGKNLYEYIKDSIETINNAENIFSKYINLEKGRIRIGGGNALTSSLILNQLISFIEKYPNIEISIISGITDSLVQKLENGELDIVVLNLPYKNKKYSNIEFVPLKKSIFCFFASKEYLKKHQLNEIKELENHVMILPTSQSVKRSILEYYCNEKKLSLNSKYEVSSSSVMKKLVLNNVGIGFINIENVQDIKDQIEIVEEIEIESTQEGIATLNKNMCNKATLELVKEIKEYYKKN